MLEKLKLDIKIRSKFLNEAEVSSLTNLLVNIHPSGPVWRAEAALQASPIQFC